MASKIQSNLSSIEGFKKINNMFGKFKGAVSPEKIKSYAVGLGTSKGLTDKQVVSEWDKVMRFLATVGAGMTAISVWPLTAIIVIVALIKSGDFNTFVSNLKDAMSEIRKGITQTNSDFEAAMQVGALAWTYFMVCLIPPWIQAIVLMPASAIVSLFAFVYFVAAFLKQFG